MNRDSLRVNGRRPRWQVGVVALALSGLILSGCAPQDAVDGGEQSPDESAPTESAQDEDQSTEEDGEAAPETDESADSTEPEPEPEIEAEDGFWRLNTLPEPVAEQVMEAPVAEAGGEVASAKLEVLSLDTDGEFARMVVAWLPPEDGAFLGSESLQNEPGRVADRPYMRLLDRDAGQAHMPLLTTESTFDAQAPADIEQDASAVEEMDPWRIRRTCVCSEVTTANAADSGEPDQMELMFVDFPAPDSDAVDILPSQWHEPITDVPVSDGEPFEFDAEDEFTEVTMPSIHDEVPGEDYGNGAEYAESFPIQARSESLTGVSTTVDGESQEVSLPGDVLFEFGEATLTAEAESIISDAAQKLNEEASGQTIRVEGHTDNVDGHDINQPLSEDRAEAVAEVIEPKLDDEIEVETEGFSFNRPLVPNQDADGNDLPDNRELNRRVSFRYTVVDEDSGVEIDLGYEELEELPQAEETEAAAGAAASYILEAPEEDRNENDVRIDVLDTQRDGESVSLQLGVALTEGSAFDEEAFSTFGGASTARQFGRSTYQDGSLSAPNMLNISLVDPNADRQYFPVMLGDQGCLCSERLSTYEGLGPDAVPAYATFELPEELDGPLILRVPDGGQIELPEDTFQ